MATLEQIRQKMLEMAPQLGSSETPASGAATTVVVSRLASGTLSAGAYTGKWMLRPDAASAADRAGRIITNYASSTGTLTHAGANWSDTTFTSEVLEIHRFDPQRIDRAIAYAVGTTRKLDMDIFPVVPNKTDYDLSALSWIQEEDDILAVGWRGSPVVNRNRNFDKWAAANPGAEADHWTLAGSGSSITRATGTPSGRYGVAITRAGTNVTLTQTVGLLENGVSGDSLRGKTLVFGLRGSTSVAGQLRLAVADGTQTVTTSYHTGGGSYEELREDIVIASTATTLTVQVQVNVDGTATVDDVFLAVGASVTDAMRRDTYPVTFFNRDEWEFGDIPYMLRLPSRGRGGQYVVYSARPIPTWSASTIAGGTADAQEVDIPTDTAAIAALARFYRELASANNENTTRYQQLFGRWEAERERAQMKLLQIPGRPPRDFGINFLPPVMAPVAAR